MRADVPELIWCVALCTQTALIDTGCGTQQDCVHRTWAASGFATKGRPMSALRVVGRAFVRRPYLPPLLSRKSKRARINPWTAAPTKVLSQPELSSS